MPHSNETSNLSRPGSGLSLSVLGLYKYISRFLIIFTTQWQSENDRDRMKVGI